MTAIAPGYRNSSHATDARIGVIASRQRGLITVWQLTALGLTRSAISRRVDSGRLVRVRRGVYSVAGPVHDAHTERLAMVLACPPGSALGGIASIEVRNFVRFTTETPVIEVPKQCRVRLTGADIHITRAQAEGHVRTVHSSLVTSIPWSIGRLGTELNAAEICHVIHQACWRHLIRPEELQLVLQANRSWRGHAVVMAALLEFLAGSAGTKSFLEDTFVRIFERVAGYTPRVNVHVDLGLESVEVDIPLLQRGLLIEVDGPPHDEPPQQAKDRARDAMAANAGLVTARFHWRLIRHRPDECEARLHALLFG